MLYVKDPEDAGGVGGVVCLIWSGEVSEGCKQMEHPDDLNLMDVLHQNLWNGQICLWGDGEVWKRPLPIMGQRTKSSSTTNKMTKWIIISGKQHFFLSKWLWGVKKQTFILRNWTCFIFMTTANKMDARSLTKNSFDPLGSMLSCLQESSSDVSDEQQTDPRRRSRPH